MCLSMDGRWALHRMAHFGGIDGTVLYLRRRAVDKLGGFNPLLWPRVKPFECDHKTPRFSEWIGQLNGPNSGYCALNLAYILRPEVLYLYGFDHSGGHFHPEYEWTQRGEGSRNGPRKFQEWASYCDTAAAMFKAAGVNVINTNRNSLIRSFKFGEAPK